MVSIQNMRPLHFAAGCLALSCILFLFPTIRVSSLGERLRNIPEIYSSAISKSTPAPPKSFHVALASTFGAWHFDVMVPVARSFEHALGGRQDCCRLYVEQPYHLGDFGFDEVVNMTGIYHGEQFNHTQLMADMSRTDLFPDDPSAMIDLVVFGTCEYDMNYWSKDLLEIWEARPSDKKFQIACIVHEVSDHRSFTEAPEWAIRGAIRYLTISDHVSDNLIQYLRSISDGQDPNDYYSLLEYTKIDVHAPVLPLPDPIKPPRGSRRLANATIQGLMHKERRDYVGILRDLWEAFKEDPQLWGYLPPLPGTKEYIPDPTSPDQPFQLHFTGSQGYIDELPDELRNVVKFHRDLNYTEYYKVMQTMDVVLPAFKDEHYFDEKASSTVVMAIQCNVPILATRRFRSSYRYAADDRVLITRPAALREVHALQLLRGSATLVRRDVDPQPLSKLLETYVPKMAGHARIAFERDIKRMLELGWERSNEEYKQFKKELWKKNEDLARRIVEGR